MKTGADTKLKVYWRPGCSSCVKVKEFLAQQGVAFESIDVSARPEAMQDLARWGVKTVPVVSRGDEYVFAQALEDVSRFVGAKFDASRLPPEELMGKWLHVLRAAQRHAQQIPAARMHERATEGRDRSILTLAYHVYQIPDAFLQAIQDGVPNMAKVYDTPLPGAVRTSADVVGYGSKMEKRLEAWWQALPDKSCRQTVHTYYGERPLHELLERCTWHSAQHARQIIAVLERLGVAPDRPLTQTDYAGLPMPKGLWE
ncbi:MAG TPA: glutaredoxin domain-containing protein [Burkholderiales bacterium]|nr:glutaredoxin domain-containing protein [Burkholderiales bacterium]